MKKVSTVVLTLILCMLFALTACVKEDILQAEDELINKGEATNTAGPNPQLQAYDYTALYKLCSAIEKADFPTLLQQLQVPKTFSIPSIKYEFTASGNLYIVLPLTLSEGMVYPVDQTAQMQDQIMLFTLIEDLQRIEYRYSQNNYDLGSMISRVEAVKVFGKDLTQYANSEALFTQDFAQKLEATIYTSDVKSTISYDEDICYMPIS